MKADARRLVIDASVTVAWCFAEEANKISERALDLLYAGAEAVVPALWPFEVANALLVAEQRKRISGSIITALLDRFASFQVSVEPGDAVRTFGQILLLARQQNLTVYDAAYLELASRRALPLATLDDQLRRAARHAGVPLI